MIAPLAVITGVFYAARTLGEPWRTLTRFDPINYLFDATRAGFTGFHEASVPLSLGVAAVTAVFAFGRPGVEIRLVASGAARRSAGSD